MIIYKIGFISKFIVEKVSLKNVNNVKFRPFSDVSFETPLILISTNSPLIYI